MTNSIEQNKSWSFPQLTYGMDTHTIVIRSGKNNEISIKRQGARTLLEVDPAAVYFESDLDALMQVTDFFDPEHSRDKIDDQNRKLALGYAAYVCASNPTMDNGREEKYLFDTFNPTRPILDTASI